MNKWVEQEGVENPKPLSHVSHKKEKIHKFKKIFFLGGGGGKNSESGSVGRLSGIE